MTNNENNKVPAADAAKVAEKIAEALAAGADLEDAAATVATMVVTNLVTFHGWDVRDARTAAIGFVSDVVRAMAAILD